MTSLRRRVAWWLLPPLVILLAINAWLAYQSALVAANRAYDRSLIASIKSIGERTYSLDGTISIDIPYAAFEMFEGGAQERIFYAVIGPDGELLTGYPDLAAPSTPGTDGQVAIGNGVYRGETVRVGALRKRLYDPVLVGGDTVTILFAETTDSRTSVARELFLDSLNRQALLLVVGVLLLLFALGSAFRPLLALRDNIGRRAEEDLTPVPAENVPVEVRPLIDAINRHMERLARMLDARRRFFADAAHQIRTPLAVLSTQVEYGLRQDDPAEIRRTFESLLRSVRSARRLANQMLTMSRAEVVGSLAEERGEVDLDALVKEVAMDLVPLAMAKRIDLAFEGPETAVVVDGNATMLRELVANLIDNAVRYTPQGGQVVTAVAAWGGDAVISVSDDGPGIPEAERENVFKRFYRILGQQDTEGSGLGLAIVREICWAHGGRVTLKDGEGGRGLTVEVELPRAETGAAAGYEP